MQVRNVAEIIQTHKIRRRAMFSHNKRLAGILSAADLTVCGHKEQLIGVVEGRVYHKVA